MQVTVRAFTLFTIDVYIIYNTKTSGKSQRLLVQSATQYLQPLVLLCRAVESRGYFLHLFLGSSTTFAFSAL